MKRLVELMDILQMVASIAAVHDSSESQRQLQTLQEENFLLKQQLSKSMTSMISTGKVSVTSAEKGDIVLVVWSEEHSNYQIYHEVNLIEMNRSITPVLHVNAIFRVPAFTSCTRRAWRRWA